MWSLQPGRYPDASAWLRHYALPRGVQALLPALVLGEVTGILVGTALRWRTQVPAGKPGADMDDVL